MAVDAPARNRNGVSAFMLLAAALIGRVAAGGLAIVLVVALAGTYGYAQAGSVFGVYILAAAIATPLKGRLADRFQNLSYFLVMGTVSLAALAVCIIAINRTPSSLPALAALLVTALTAPPVDSSIRVAWRRVVREDLLRRIHTIDSLLDEVGYVLGPLMAGGLLGFLSPSHALSVVIGLSAISLALFIVGAIRSGFLAQAKLSEHAEPLPRLAALIGPFTSSRMWVIVTPMAAMGVVFGALAIYLPAYTSSVGHVATAGPLISTISVGGVTGGILFGFREWRWPLLHQYFVLTCAFLVLSSWFYLAGSTLSLFLYCFLAGLWVTPLYICGYLLVDELIDIRQRHEANIWLGASTDVFHAFSAALMGLAISQEDWSGARAGVSVFAAVAVLASLALWGRNRSVSRKAN